MQHERSLVHHQHCLYARTAICLGSSKQACMPLTLHLDISFLEPNINDCHLTMACIWHLTDT